MTDRPNIYYERTENGKIRQDASWRLHEWCLNEDRNRLIRFKQLLLEEAKREAGNTSCNKRRVTVNDVPIPRFDLYMLPTVTKKPVKRAKVKRDLLKGSSCTFEVDSASSDVREEEDSETADKIPEWQKRIDQYLKKYRRENIYTKEWLAETNEHELRKVLSKYNKDGLPIVPLTDSEEEEPEKDQDQETERSDYQPRQNGAIQVSSIKIPKPKHQLKKKKKKRNSVTTTEINDAVSTEMPVGEKKTNFSSLPDLSVTSKKSKSSKGRRKKRSRIAKPNFVREILNREECQAWRPKYSKETKKRSEMVEEVDVKAERSVTISPDDNQKDEFKNTYQTKLDARPYKPISLIDQGNELRKGYRLKNRSKEPTIRAIPVAPRFSGRETCDISKPSRNGEYIQPHITPIMPLDRQFYERESYNISKSIRRKETRDAPKLINRFSERESNDRLKTVKKKHELTAIRAKDQGDMLNSSDFLSATPILPSIKPAAERRNRVKDLIGYHEIAKTQYKQRDFLDKKPTIPFIKILEPLSGDELVDTAEDLEVTEILPPQFTADDQTLSDNEVIICGFLGLKQDPREEFNIIIDKDEDIHPKKVRKTKRRSASTLRRFDSGIMQRIGDRSTGKGDGAIEDIKSIGKNLDDLCRPRDLDVYYSEMTRDIGVGEGKNITPTANEVTDLLGRLDINPNVNHTQPYQLNSDHCALRTTPMAAKHVDFASSTQSDYVLDGGSPGRNMHHRVANDNHNISRFTATHECGLYPPPDYQQRIDQRARDLSRTVQSSEATTYNTDYLLELASRSNTIQRERQTLDEQTREQSCQTISNNSSSLSDTRVSKWTESVTCGLTRDNRDVGDVIRSEILHVDTGVGTSDDYLQNEYASDSMAHVQDDETSGNFDNHLEETPHCNSPIYGRTEVNLNEGFEEEEAKSRIVTSKVTNIVFGEEKRCNSRKVSRDNIKIERFVKSEVRKPSVRSVSVGTTCDGTSDKCFSPRLTVSRGVNQIHKRKNMQFHSTDRSVGKATKKSAVYVPENGEEKPAFQYKLVSSAMLTKTAPRPVRNNSGMKLSNNAFISRCSQEALVGVSEYNVYNNTISTEKRYQKRVGAGDRSSSELPFRVDGATSTDEVTSTRQDFPRTITPTITQRNYGLKWYKTITPYPPNHSTRNKKPNMISTGVGTSSESNVGTKPLNQATRKELPMSYNKHKLRLSKSPTNVPGITNLSNLVPKANAPLRIYDKVGELGLPRDLNDFYLNSLKRDADPVGNPNANTKKRLHWSGHPLDPGSIAEDFNNFVKHENLRPVESGSSAADVDGEEDNLTIDIHSSRSCTDIKISCKEVDQLGVISVCDQETQKIIDMRRARRDKNRHGPEAYNLRRTVNAKEGTNKPTIINYRPSSRKQWKIYENR